MILQLRGTSGSGKTTLMKQVMADANCEPFRYAPAVRSKPVKKVRVYKGTWGELPLYVFGDYSIGAGGCDNIPTVQEVIDLLDEFATPTHKKRDAIICFEGLLLAHSWGALGEFAHEHYGNRYFNVFLDTPKEVCLARVLQRRAEKGGDTPPDRLAKIEKNVIADHYRVELCWKRVLARGGQRLMIPHKKPYPHVRVLLDSFMNEQRLFW